jgi:glucosamine--fructose-6-phosphate aminotransferase (isomerizing)
MRNVRRLRSPPKSGGDFRLRANAHDLIVLPQAGPLLNPLLAVLPLQLLSYRLSLARGYDPDFPRNLSKTLTVD